MMFFLIHSIYSINQPIKDLFIGNWLIKSHEIFFEDNLDFNHSYHVSFLEYEQISLVGDLFENFDNSKTKLITTVKLDFSELIAIVWTGSLKYFYKLIKIKFIESRNQTFVAQGKFIDGTGDYMISIYSPLRIDMTIYEKGKVTYFSMEKESPHIPFIWMSKYFYFLPVTILLITIIFIPCKKEQTKKTIKPKID